MADGSDPNEKPFEDLGAAREPGPENSGGPSKRPPEMLGGPSKPPEDYAPQRQSVEGQRESVRGIIAGILVAILGTTTIGTVVLLASGHLDGGQAELVSQLFVTPLVAIVGTVVGFYFGGQTATSAAASGSANGGGG